MFSSLIDRLPAASARKLNMLMLRRGYGGPVTPRTGHINHILPKLIPNRIGLAAGFDPSAQAPAAWQRLGFGFAELGSVTVNPKNSGKAGREWRVGERGLIHSGEFGNPGLTVFAENLKAFRDSDGGSDFCVGANILSPDGRGNEIRMLGQALVDLVDYFTINASCPNTAMVQTALSGPIREIKALVGPAEGKPIFVKIEPTVRLDVLEAMVESFLLAGATGFVAGSSLSSHSRDLLPGITLPWPVRGGPHPVKFGAFSGPELRDINLAMVATLRRLAPDATIIASGGIYEKSDLEDYLGAGADLFQIHTALARGGREAVERLIHADGEIGTRAQLLQAAE